MPNYDSPKFDDTPKINSILNCVDTPNLYDIQNEEFNNPMLSEEQVTENSLNQSDKDLNSQLHSYRIKNLHRIIIATLKGKGGGRGGIWSNF